MRTRILLCAAIVLFLGGALHAGDWKPLNNNLWSDPDNWSTGLLPVPGERTTINDPPECHLDIETLIGNLQISDGGALMIADGGILTAYGWVHVGKNNEGSLTVTNGGVLNAMGVTIIGRNTGSEGHLTIGYGGTVNIQGNFQVTNKEGSSGFVHLDGGILNIDAPLLFNPF